MPDRDLASSGCGDCTVGQFCHVVMPVSPKHSAVTRVYGTKVLMVDFSRSNEPLCMGSCGWFERITAGSVVVTCKALALRQYLMHVLDIRTTFELRLAAVI